jgi:hypothetical protein
MHLTDDLDTLAAIIRKRLLQAGRAYGALYIQKKLSESQRVACFSEIDLSDISRLAERHGPFGVGFPRRWTQSRGAAPV